MGTALKHLVDSIFLNLSNTMLVCRDSYLENVKPGIKPDTLKNLRNAPMFIPRLCFVYWSHSKLIRAPRITPVGGVVPDIALMKDNNSVRAWLKEIRDNGSGDNSPEIGTEVVAG